MAMIEKKSKTEINKAMNSGQPTKAHRHRLLEPLHGHGRTSSSFTPHCCLHLYHNHHQCQEKVSQGAVDVDGEEGRGPTRASNKDWRIEYQPVPLEAPVCRSCSQQDGHCCHGGSGSGVRVEFRGIRVSLDWILSGFMNKA